MKKLIFLFAMVFAVSMTMAQNTATTTQTGDLNQASTTQTNQSNELTVTQTNNNLSSTITPDGKVNRVISSQNSTGSKNTAAINQTQAYGSGDFGHGKADGNWAELIQNGGGNDATITQVGRNESFHHTGRNNGMGAFVTQIGNDNDAILYQNGVGNLGSIYQEGNGNEAKSEIKTNSDNNRLTISQLTNLNKAFQVANGPGYFNDHTMRIEQKGDNENWASQRMDGYLQKDGGNLQDIVQNGYKNEATQELESNASGYPMRYNNQYIRQNGNENKASMVLYNVSTGGDRNYALITQQTDYNEANLIQSGHSNSTTITQEVGNGNVVNLTQGGGADANILQQGTENKLMGLGTDIMATSLNGSTLDLDQIGSGNTLHLQQTNGASATVMQDGMTNTSVVIQN